MKTLSEVEGGVEKVTGKKEDMRRRKKKREVKRLRFEVFLALVVS